MSESLASIKKLVILGSTGSIGRQTLDVVRALPDKFQIVGLAAGDNLKLLEEQIREFSPQYILHKNPKAKMAGALEFIPMEEMAD